MEAQYILKDHPVGQCVPDSEHAVCCSLPTMADVIGYEERHPQTMEAVTVGYPRFIPHHYVRAAADHTASKHGQEGKAVYVVPTLKAAKQMESYVQAKECSIGVEAGFAWVSFSTEESVFKKAKSFLQHTGLSISSRQAEDYLLSEGLIDGVQAEDYLDVDAEAYVIGALRQSIDADAITLTINGMNAFYAAFKAAQKLQNPKGKNVYLVLGWLYLDTQKIVDEFLNEGESVITIYDVFDTAKIEAVFAEKGDQLAAVITELPTNPLVHTLDFEHLSALAKRHKAIRIIDPTIACLGNVNILPHTDILVSSLTKYAGSRGDVMSGVFALNEQSPFYDEASALIAKEFEPPYHRDLQRLAWQIQDMPDVLDKINANTVELAAYFEKHPQIKRVHWSYSELSKNNFEKIAISADRPGSIITIELEGDLASFYNRAQVVKGPSFGTHFTMMCPFMYLAHYDLVTDEKERANLEALGLDPELVRVSVGIEPIEAIIEAFEKGFDSHV